MLDARLTEAADRFGTPAYIYATDIVETRLADLRAHLGRCFAEKAARCEALRLPPTRLRRAGSRACGAMPRQSSDLSWEMMASPFF